MGVNNVLSGQTKKKTSRETGKRERKEREMEKERVTTIYPNMIHVNNMVLCFEHRGFVKRRFSTKP